MGILRKKNKKKRIENVKRAEAPKSKAARKKSGGAAGGKSKKKTPVKNKGKVKSKETVKRKGAKKKTPVKSGSQRSGKRRGKTVENTRRDQAKRSPTRRMFWGLLFTLGAYFFFLGVFLLWKEGGAFVEKHRWFDVDQIDVVGNERISKEEIIQFSGLKHGVYIFDVDVKKAGKKIGSHPWIKRARVSRRLPDDLLVVVEEQHPAGIIKLGRLYYVNDDGTPFKLAPKKAKGEYVAIDGLDRADFKSPELGAGKVRRGLDMIRAYRKHAMNGYAPLKSITFRHNGFELIVGDVPTTLVIGKSNIEEAFDRAAKLWRHLLSRKQSAQVIHLDNRLQADRVPVRLTASSAK